MPTSEAQILFRSQLLNASLKVTFFWFIFIACMGKLIPELRCFVFIFAQSTFSYNSSKLKASIWSF